jgi:transcriptional regulator with XRE-family HTH domain
VELHRCEGQPPAYPNFAAELARRGITRRVLADAVGVHPNTLTNINSGVMLPSASLRARIALALGKTEDELFGEQVPA